MARFLRALRDNRCVILGNCYMMLAVGVQVSAFVAFVFLMCALYIGMTRGLVIILPPLF